ncbi:FHA domain-containing protein [Arthrobacter sp. ISL-28]|uniref:FHA domain-containing protein n=1 Tax=Arthrobacter sp. ISL-28 TaxID=2819108 RepID=UPI001BE91BD4|nr:FHA domain-containing protein [Arthrobacter sp. ISL-28]MBT2520523.1 hypothetical protein [Arthrobacter sp. ISL-28]
MTAANYAPGTWFGLVRSGTAVILGPEAPPELVRTLWKLLQDRPEMHDVLHAVTGGLGVPLSSCPSFGIIGFRESLRVFLRGDLDLRVQQQSGTVELDGRNVTTWTERWLDSPERFNLTVPSAAGKPGEPGTLELPVAEGVVLLRSLHVDVTGKAAGGAAGTWAVTGSSAEASAETMVGLPETMFDGAALAGPALGRTELDTAGLGGFDVDASEEADLQVTALGGTAIGETRLEEPEREVAEREEPEQEDSGNPAELPAAAIEFTSSYDHLWDKTVMRSIEDAAIRTGEDHDGGPQTASASPEARKESERAHADAAGDATDQGTAGPGVQGTDSTAKDGTAPHRGGAAQSVGRREPEGPEERGSGGLTSGGLIDSLPWATGGNRGAGPSAPPSFISPPDSRPAGWAIPQSEQNQPAQNQPAQNQPTQSRPVQSQPVQNRVASAPAEAPALPYLAEGDHDGQTVFKSDLIDASAQTQAAPGAAPGVTPGDGPRVLARVCGSGHANPPTSGQCSTCGALLPDVAVQVPRPRLGRLRLSTGEVIELEESLVIGRQPSVSRVQGGAMPRLVQVASPGGDISRSHVEVRLEGWHVMLCDLKATNGTVLVREGQPPRRLAQNEMAIVLDGDIAQLGDDVSLRFEEIL